jgi:hypothetical protein
METNRETSSMSIQPQGEEVRRAVKWVAEQIEYEPQKKLAGILEEAGLRFDLSPLEMEFLQRFYREGTEGKSTQ